MGDDLVGEQLIDDRRISVREPYVQVGELGEA
jgi:hypothetical protein